MPISDDIELYFRSVDRRWRKEIEEGGLVRVFSPFLTPGTADSVIMHADPADCEVYTLFSLNSFASGASSLTTLEGLLDMGYSLYHIDRLHAKVVLCQKSFVSVGSQNLTSGGIYNQEGSVVLKGPEYVDAVEKLVEPWVRSSVAITEQMVAEAFEDLPELRRLYRSFERRVEAVAAKFEEEILNAQPHPLAKDAERKARARQYRSAVATKLKVSGPVLRDVCERLLRGSVWWHSHSSGRPVRAPGHADRMYRGPDGWTIDFGANSFLVETAVNRCIPTVLSYADSVEAGDEWDQDVLQGRLSRRVRGAVANQAGYEYQSLYPLEGPDMMFGVTSIDVEDFVNIILSILGLSRPGGD